MSEEQAVASLGARAIWFRDERGMSWVGGFDQDGGADLHVARPEDVQVLFACDRARSIAALASDVGRPVEDVLRVLSVWQARIPGSLRWMNATDERADARRAVAFDMLLEARTVEGMTSRDNRDYHHEAITEATQQFEDVETTVSHAYSEAHPGLAGRAYGAAFFDRCRAAGAIREGLLILEVGCGTGRFASAFLDRFAQRMPEVYGTARYVMFDIAPALAASQRKLTRRHENRVAFVAGDIEEHVFSERFDLVLANEMVADLSVEAVERDRPHETSFAMKYGLTLDGGLRRLLVNAGAIRLVEQIASILRPGGHAFVTEYGSLDAFPVAVKLGEHTEHSIHFGHLMQVAHAQALEAHCEPLDVFLEFDTSCEVIRADSLALLRRLSLRLFGELLPKRAYTRSQLRARLGAPLDRIQNVRFVSISDDASVLCPGRFRVLHLSRGRTAPLETI